MSRLKAIADKFAVAILVEHCPGKALAADFLDAVSGTQGRPAGLEAPLKATATGLRRRELGTVAKKVDLAYRATRTYLAE